MTTCECGNPAPLTKDREGYGVCKRCRAIQRRSRDLALKKKVGTKEKMGMGGQMAMNWETHWGDTKPIAGIGDSLKLLEEKLCQI